MNIILSVYKKLYRMYGPQGWWPIDNEYHKRDFSYPKTGRQQLEVCLGAILTQNTSWKNVEKALENLKKNNLIDPKKISSIDKKRLANIIRSSGYHNQKAKKLKIFSRFYLSLKGRAPSRDELLEVWGIGPETADSILLYAYNQSEFVVDAYTRRLLASMNIITEKFAYDEIKLLFENNLPKDYRLFQEYHALIVENGKNVDYNRKYSSKK